MARSSSPVSSRQITSIVMMIALLVAVIVLRTRCAAGTAKIFEAVTAARDGGARGVAGPADGGPGR